MLKIEGDKIGGYNLLKLGGCGLWQPISHHDSRERAEQAMERQEHLAVMQKSWGKVKEERKEK